jgi:phosphate transport system permease protein
MDTKTKIPEGLRKRMRPSDWIAAQSIRAVAVVSLITIFLILVFVVKEAVPVFSGHAGTSREVAVAASSKSADAAPESYGSSDTSAAAPESYGDDSSSTAAASSSKGDSASATAAQESYGGGPSDASAASASEVSASAAAPNEEAAPKPFTPWNLLSLSWSPVSTEQPMFGVWPLVLGSLKVTLIALLIGGPVAILSALYTTTFAPRWARELMKPAIELLAGIPSVVLGFFTLVVLASILQGIFHWDFRLNAFVGGVGMALAVIPIIYTVSEDAIAAIPRHLTEGSLALGATKWETNFLVVLPAATPGIFAALLLGVGRAFGETMIVLMATGNAALIDPGLAKPVRTLSASIGAEMAEVVQGDLHYSVLFFLGVLLFAFSFGLNAVAEFGIRDRLLKRFKGI